MINLNMIIAIMAIVVFLVTSSIILTSLCTNTKLSTANVLTSLWLGLLVALVLYFVIRNMVSYITPNVYKIEKYSSVDSVIYDAEHRGTSKFSYKKDKNDENYKHLSVWFEENINEPYIANITFTDKSNTVEFTGKYLVLDESYKDYGLNIIFSKNDAADKNLENNSMQHIIFGDR